MKKLEECNYTAFTIRGRRCPECGVPVKSKTVTREPKKSKFDGLFQCEKCSLISLLPYPDDATVASFYEGEGCIQKLSLEEAQIPNRRRRKKIEQLVESKPDSLYEVGASRGIFLAYMKRHGWRVAGIEPAPKPVKYAREVFGLELEQAFFDPDRHANVKHDVVVAWDVLEHCKKPSSILKAMFRRVRDGGLVVISVPHIDGLPAKFFRERWRYRMTPVHLHFFPLQWFELQTQLLGGTIVSMEGFAKVHAWLQALLPQNHVARLNRQLPHYPNSGNSRLSRVRELVRKIGLRFNHTSIPLAFADILEIAIRVH